MNRLIIVIAAAAGALLFRRRKTIKEDTDRVKNATRDGARKLNNRLRGDSDGDESSDDEPIVDLADDAGTDDAGTDDAGTDDASSEVKASTSATD